MVIKNSLELSSTPRAKRAQFILLVYFFVADYLKTTSNYNSKEIIVNS